MHVQTNYLLLLPSSIFSKKQIPPWLSSIEKRGFFTFVWREGFFFCRGIGLSRDAWLCTLMMVVGNSLSFLSNYVIKFIFQGTTLFIHVWCIVWNYMKTLIQSLNLIVRNIAPRVMHKCDKNLNPWSNFYHQPIRGSSSRITFWGDFFHSFCFYNESIVGEFVKEDSLHRVVD